jgi:hypothetical protein
MRVAAVAALETELADPAVTPTVAAAPPAATVTAAITNVILECFLAWLRRVVKIDFRSGARNALGFHPRHCPPSRNVAGSGARM